MISDALQGADDVVVTPKGRNLRPTLVMMVRQWRASHGFVGEGTLASVSSRPGIESKMGILALSIGLKDTVRTVG